jgi:deoxyribodipyrimidine photolyase
MNIVWFRRNLRLEDNVPLQRAIAANKPFVAIFIFDTNILTRFNNSLDRRVNFLASAIFSSSYAYANYFLFGSTINNASYVSTQALIHKDKLNAGSDTLKTTSF